MREAARPLRGQSRLYTPGGPSRCRATEPPLPQASATLSRRGSGRLTGGTTTFGVTFTPAADSPAGSWTSAATSTLGAPFPGPGCVAGDGASPGVKTLEVRDMVNVAAAPRRSLRVRVTH